MVLWIAFVNSVRIFFILFLILCQFSVLLFLHRATKRLHIIKVRFLHTKFHLMIYWLFGSISIVFVCVRCWILYLSSDSSVLPLLLRFYVHELMLRSFFIFVLFLQAIVPYVYTDWKINSSTNYRKIRNVRLFTTESCFFWNVTHRNKEKKNSDNNKGTPWRVLHIHCPWSMINLH